MAYFLIFFGLLMRFVTHFDNLPIIESLTRNLPHIPNFSPIAAIALFSGVYLTVGKNKLYAILVPLLALFISDIFIGFYSPVVMLSVYGSFVLIGLIGLWLKNHKTVANTLGASLFGSIIFFLITNFAMWAIPHSLYPHSLQGLLNCYTMGLPFFRNTLLGDLFYTGVLFSLMEVILYITKTYELRRTKHGFAFRRIV